MNYLVFSSVFKGKVYAEIVKMAMDSKFLKEGYLIFMRESLASVKGPMRREKEELNQSQQLFIN